MLKPTIGNIAIRIDKAPETFDNGLYRPDQAKSVQNTAEVIAVSEGVRTRRGDVIPHGIDVGDKILLAVTFAGAEVTYEGEKIVIVPVSEVAAVLA